MALLLDETAWDLALPVRKATAEEQIRQTVGIRLKTIRGEWEFDLEQGLPFYGVMMGVNPNLVVVESVVRLECELVPGVVRAQRCEAAFVRSTRELSITVDLLTDAGLITVTA